MKREWSPSDISRTIRMLSNDLEFEDEKGEWHNFTVIATPDRVVFGDCCNCGFIESGYIERDLDGGESLDETLQEMLTDLECYYNDGPDFVERIVCNERM